MCAYVLCACTLFVLAGLCMSTCTIVYIWMCALPVFVDVSELISLYVQMPLENVCIQAMCMSVCLCIYLCVSAQMYLLPKCLSVFRRKYLSCLDICTCGGVCTYTCVHAYEYGHSCTCMYVGGICGIYVYHIIVPVL